MFKKMIIYFNYNYKMKSDCGKKFIFINQYFKHIKTCYKCNNCDISYINNKALVLFNRKNKFHIIAQDFINLCIDQQKLTPHKTKNEIIIDSIETLKDIYHDLNETIENRIYSRATILASENKNSELNKYISNML